MATVAGCHSNRSYDAVGRFVGRRDGLVAVVRNPNAAETSRRRGNSLPAGLPTTPAKVALGSRQSASGLPHRCGRNNCTI